MVGARYGAAPGPSSRVHLDGDQVDERHRRRPFENFCHSRETRKDELRRADARNKPDK